MTRKDYVAIAAVIKAQADSDGNKGGHTITQNIALNIARVMAADNSRFDEARFLKACGVAS